MRRFTFVLLVVLLALNAYPQKKAKYSNKLLLEVAIKGLQKQLELIKHDAIAYYGFNSMEELKLIKFGIPYRIYTLSENFYNSSDSEFYNSIFAKNEWLVPLLINDSIRAFLTIGLLKDKLQVVGLGANLLGASITECEKSNKKWLKGKSKSLLRVYPLKMDFIMATTSGKNNSEIDFFPTNSIKSCCAEAFNRKGNYNKNEVLSKVKKRYLQTKK